MELLHTDFIHLQKHWWRSKKSLTLECHNLFIGLSYTLEKLQTLSTHNKNTTDRITAENFVFSDFFDKWKRRLTGGIVGLIMETTLSFSDGAASNFMLKNRSQMSQKKPPKQIRAQNLTTHTPVWMFACASVSTCFHDNDLPTLNCQMMCAAQPAHARAVFSALTAEFYLRF